MDRAVAAGDLSTLKGLRDVLRGNRMVQNKDQYSKCSERGFSLVELMIILACVSILSAVAIPQVITQRRLMRSAGITREIAGQIRLARQFAMAQRKAFTFQYDNTNKKIKIIGPIPVGTLALVDPSYPNNTGSSVVSTASLTQGGLSSGEISYGIPTASDLPSGAPAIPTGPLADGISKTDLTSGMIRFTFQPDGSVIDSTGSLANRALFFFNNKTAQSTASAVSMMGSSGRVKMWRYTTSGNKYTE